MSKSFLISLIASVVCILWFMSLFTPNAQFEAIKDNQEDINSIVTDLSSNRSNTLVIAGYDIPVVGEIFTPIIQFLALIGATIAIVLRYIIAFFGISAYIPIEVYPAFGILGIMIIMSVIAFIRLGRD